MWIASKFGFFSIVKKGEDEWHVRARAKKDLNNLLRAVGMKEPITSSLISDYKFRIVVDADFLRLVFWALEDSLDYNNFKGEIGKRKGQRDKLDIYHKWWSDMLGYQAENGYVAHPRL